MKEETYVVPQGTSVRIGEPGTHGMPLIQALQTYFSTSLVVDKAYLLWMERNGEGSYLLVLDSMVDIQPCFPAIEQICHTVSVEAPLDIISAHTDFGNKAITNRQPFYTHTAQLRH